VLLHVTNQPVGSLLYREGKESVVLYVSHDNPAEKVYHRVGFTGLCGTPRPAAVEDWIEVGFQVLNFVHRRMLRFANELIHHRALSEATGKLSLLNPPSPPLSV
jgi:hypothetical protein